MPNGRFCDRGRRCVRLWCCMGAIQLETQTIDGIPVIDRIAEASNVLIGAGWSGHGWAIAPAVCRQLAEWAVDGEPPDQLRPFAYGRFL